MSSAGRATKMPLALYPEVGPTRKSGLKSGRAGEISLSTPGLDLASKLRTSRRSLRGRVERRDALLDMIRAVNATLDPDQVAESIVERAATWVPAPCWAVVCSDASGQVRVAAHRGFGEELTDTACRIAAWVMNRG